MANEKIDVMDKDELIATLCTCNEKVSALKAEYAENIAPTSREMREVKTALTAYMAEHGIECLKLEEDVYLRLFRRIGSGETLTPMLFMDIVNKLTSAQFIEKARQIEEDRNTRRRAWLEKNRVEIKKDLLKKRQQAEKKRTSGPRARTRVTKRVKLECMADAACALGVGAASHVSEILQAGRNATKSALETEDDVEPEAHAGAGAGAGEEEFGSDDDDDIDARVEKALAALPFPEAKVKYTGKDKAYAQRPLPAFGLEPLTSREMLIEVLYGLIRDRHKPIKPVVTVETRPGKAAVVMAHGPKPLFGQAKRFIELKTKISALQSDNATKKKAYRAVMNRCKERLLPVLTSKYEASMPTGTGLRTISVEVVKKEEVRKRLNMWEMAGMLEEAAASASSSRVGDSPFDLDAPLHLLSEEVMSHFIRVVLKKMAVFTAEHTTVSAKVSIRRSRERHDGDSDASDGSSVSQDSSFLDD